MLWWIVQHLLVTLVLAIVATMVGMFMRGRPVLRHALWLIVLVKFVTPAFVYWPAEISISESFFAKDSEDTVSPRPMAWAFVESQSLATIKSDHDAPTVPQVSNTQEPGGKHARNEADFELNVLAALFVVWGIGSAVVLLRCSRYSNRTSRILSQASLPTEDLRFANEWAADRLRIKTPDIVVADGIASPFVWCFGKTRIVWPSRLLDASIDQK